MAVSGSQYIPNIYVSRSSRFNSSRYPTKPSDTAQKFDPKENNHVVFIRKNKLYELPIVDAEGSELSGKELERSVCYLDFAWNKVAE